MTNAAPISVSFMASHVNRVTEGLFGGEPGSLGRLAVNGQPINPTYRRTLEPGDRLELTTPGGGGFGPVVARAAASGGVTL